MKNETVEESSIKHEIKQKGDSLRRVPADENPMLKEMDDRAEVKVGLFCFRVGSVPEIRVGHWAKLRNLFLKDNLQGRISRCIRS